MADYRKLVRQLAGDPNLGQHESALTIRDRAAQIDPQGKFEVEDTWLEVDGLPRRVSLVVNHADDAGRVEFGRDSGRQGSDGRGGLRPLGRAARSVGE